jgi:hypothetical protein
VSNYITETNNDLPISESGKENKITDELTNIADALLTETDSTKLAEYTAKFNLALKKKSMYRAIKVNQLMEKAQDEIEARLTDCPEMIPTKDLTSIYRELINSGTNANAILNDAALSTNINIDIRTNSDVANLSEEERARVLAAYEDLRKQVGSDTVIDMVNDEEESE